MARWMVPLGLVLAGCGDPPAGSLCATADGCAPSFECVEVSESERRCMQPCTAGTRLCADGAACLLSPVGLQVCWYGGRTPFGAACVDRLGCEPGTVCEEGRCRQACLVGDDRPCDDGEVCAGTSSEGWCVSSPSPQDGGGAPPSDGGSGVDAASAPMDAAP
jgi:hypothetical protein